MLHHTGPRNETHGHWIQSEGNVIKTESERANHWKQTSTTKFVLYGVLLTSLLTLSFVTAQSAQTWDDPYRNVAHFNQLASSHLHTVYLAFLLAFTCLLLYVPTMIRLEVFKRHHKLMSPHTLKFLLRPPIIAYLRRRLCRAQHASHFYIIWTPPPSISYILAYVHHLYLSPASSKSMQSHVNFDPICFRRAHQWSFPGLLQRHLTGHTRANACSAKQSLPATVCR